MTALHLSQLVLSATYSGVALVAFCLAGIWAVLHFGRLKPLLKPAVMVAGVVVLLKLPSQMAGLYYLDLDVVFDRPEVAAEMSELFKQLMTVVLPLVMLMSLMFELLNQTLMLTVAEDARERSAFPWLTGARGARDGWAVGAALGLGCGLASAGLFTLLDVGMSSTVQTRLEMMPDLDPNSPLVLLLVSTPFALSAAISEELLVRGLLQRWLGRWLGGSRGAVWVAIGIASGIWAVGHALNTDAVLIKTTQIFLIGLVFGWLAERWSVETSIVAHLALNASVCLVVLVQ